MKLASTIEPIIAPITITSPIRAMQYQTNFIEVNEGEPVVVGPVEYVVTFEGTHEGDKETQPENTFLKIGIIAKNISDEKTAMSGGQFFLIDEKDQKQ
jgi:hypothetical protein